MKSVLMLFTASILFLSCFERKEGCLDSLAANYDVEAFDSCLECCSFPDVVFNMTHRAGDSLLNTQDTLVNNIGEMFNILEVRYYLSDVLIFQDNRAISAHENLVNSNNSFSRSDDISIARSNVASLTIGEFKTYGQFDKVSFRLGVDNRVLTDTFVNLTPQHPLNDRNKIQDSEGRLFQMSVRYKLIDPDTLRTIWIDSLPENLIFEKTETIQTRKGENIPFRIDANYLPLFENVVLRGNDAEVKNAMVSQVSRIFE